MQASRGTGSLPAPSPHSIVLRRRHEVCNPLVSTHRMEVGVGVVPHRLDIFKHGHRTVCGGVLISSFLDILGSWSWFWRCSGLGCRAVVIVGDEMSLQF